MTREEFIEILKRNGYKRLRSVVKVNNRYKRSWEYEHQDCLYKEFDETEVAFDVYNKKSPDVWLHIREQDAGLDTSVSSVQVINMFLAAFDADIIKNTQYNDYIMPKYEWERSILDKD